MKSLPALLGACLLLLIPACNPVKSTKAAETAVAEFHLLFNAEDYEQIYTNAHAEFKASGTKEDIISFISAVRNKAGEVKSTSKASWNVQSNNGRTYVFLTQESVFENEKGTEEFTFRMDGGLAVLVGWHVGPSLVPDS